MFLCFFAEVVINNNGRVCFQSDAYLYPAKKPTFDDHFKSSIGPCFSFLLLDIGPSKIKLGKTAKFVGSSFVGYDLTITQTNAKLFGSEYVTADEPVAGVPTPPGTPQECTTCVTYQAKLFFEGPDANSIKVTYLKLPKMVSAVVGPSNATGVPLGFEAYEKGKLASLIGAGAGA